MTVAQSTGPVRIQRKRTKGWRMPDGAVYVGRPTKWGNPYTFDMMRAHVDHVAHDLRIPRATNARVHEYAAEAFRCDIKYGPDSAWWWYGPHKGIIRILGELAELRGHDLACWCPPDSPCHADVLLEIANN